MLIPHRAPDVEGTMLPPDYQRILAAVRQAAGPIMVRQIGGMLGVDVSMPSELEPLRGRLVRVVDRGWLRKPPDGGSEPACELSHRQPGQHGASLTMVPSAAVGIV